MTRADGYGDKSVGLHEDPSLHKNLKIFK